VDIGRRRNEAIDRETPPSSKLPRTIAIDGPSASGKSDVGSLVAKRLGYRFLDTGAMYRALTWFVLENGVDPDDAERLGEIASRVTMTVSANPQGSDQHHSVLVDGQDSTPFLVRPDVEAAVSQVSRVPAVRRAMVGIQQRIAREGGVVMAGRDIGTTVLPNADLKVYLDASPGERARRRYRQAMARGEKTSLNSVLEDLTRRDAIDSSRETSPLRHAEDAITVNTDGLSLEQAVEQVLALVQ
jgi:cytidylate kinase